METEDVSAMAHLFLIKEYKVFSKPDGDIFANIFGDYRVALVGLSEPNGGNFKTLSLYYTTPETTDENTLSSMVLAYFVKILLPEVEFMDTEKFLRELSTSITKTQGGIKFSIAADGNLIFVTAVAV